MQKLLRQINVISSIKGVGLCTKNLGGRGDTDLVLPINFYNCLLSETGGDLVFVNLDNM